MNAVFGGHLRKGSHVAGQLRAPEAPRRVRERFAEGWANAQGDRGFSNRRSGVRCWAASGTARAFFSCLKSRQLARILSKDFNCERGGLWYFFPGRLPQKDSPSVRLLASCTSPRRPAVPFFHDLRLLLVWLFHHSPVRGNKGGEGSWFRCLMKSWNVREDSMGTIFYRLGYFLRDCVCHRRFSA